MKYLATTMILLGLVGLILMIPQVAESTPQIIIGDWVGGGASPDSCTRWQQWDYGYCVEKTDHPSYLGAAHFLQIITVPFIGAAAIFVVSTRTPRISKKKRVAVVIPCVILPLFSLFVIFGDSPWFF